MNALMLLKSDHKTVEELFKKFEAAGDKNPRAKRKIVDQIIRELAIHAAIEEQVFYPAVRNAIEAAEDNVLESLEEHHIVKWQLSELEGMDPESERFDAKVTVLIENVRHHVKEEEKEMFDKVRKAMTRRQLEDLGMQLQSAKKIVPTRPHPRAPDAPPGNIANVGAAALDRVRDAGRTMIARATARRGQPTARAKAATRAQAPAPRGQMAGKRGATGSRAKAASPARGRGRSAGNMA